MQQVNRGIEEAKRAIHQFQCSGQVTFRNRVTRALQLVGCSLQQELGGLMDNLKHQFVGMRTFFGRLLQREQLIGSEVPLVIGGGGSRKDRSEERRVGKEGRS